MASDFSELFERIREHCQKQGWYGPDAENPHAFGHSYILTVDPATGQEQWADRRDGIEATQFQYPAAAEDDVRSTEKMLGFPLPPVLRDLYTKVANGGFVGRGTALWVHEEAILATNHACPVVGGVSPNEPCRACESIPGNMSSLMAYQTAS